MLDVNCDESSDVVVTRLVTSELCGLVELLTPTICWWMGLDSTDEVKIAEDIVAVAVLGMFDTTVG